MVAKSEHLLADSKPNHKKNDLLKKIDSNVMLFVESSPNSAHAVFK